MIELRLNFNTGDHKDFNVFIGEKCEGSIGWLRRNQDIGVGSTLKSGWSISGYGENDFFEQGIKTKREAIAKFKAHLFKPFTPEQIEAISQACKKAEEDFEDWRRRTRVTREMMQTPINRFVNGKVDI